MWASGEVRLNSKLPPSCAQASPSCSLRSLLKFGFWAPSRVRFFAARSCHLVATVWMTHREITGRKPPMAAGPQPLCNPEEWEPVLAGNLVWHCTADVSLWLEDGISYLWRQEMDIISHNPKVFGEQWLYPSMPHATGTTLGPTKVRVPVLPCA